MANPVLDALVGMRLREEPSPFGKWAIVRNVRSLPAMPAHVAAFITDLASAGKSVKEIWPLVQEISQAHVSNGFADPTAGGVVGDMINSISMIDAPRCWPKSEWSRFKQLPYDLQLFYSQKDAERSRAIRRSQNEAAELRRILSEIEKGKANGAEKQPDENRAA
jgi:hypothetical protein